MQYYGIQKKVRNLSNDKEALESRELKSRTIQIMLTMRFNQIKRCPLGTRAYVEADMYQVIISNERGLSKDPKIELLHSYVTDGLSHL